MYKDPMHVLGAAARRSNQVVHHGKLLPLCVSTVTQSLLRKELHVGRHGIGSLCAPIKIFSDGSLAQEKFQPTFHKLFLVEIPFTASSRTSFVIAFALLSGAATITSHAITHSLQQ